MKRKKLLTTLLLLLCSISIMAGNTVTLPNESMLFSDADIVGCRLENNGAHVGSTGAKTVITFSLQNDKKGAYLLSLKSGAKGLTAVYNVTITDKTTGKVAANNDFTVSNTGSWTPSEVHSVPIPSLDAGAYSMVISVKSTTGSYAGNLGNLSIAYTGEVQEIKEVLLQWLTIDGDASDKVGELNANPYSATVSGNVYTQLPVVKAALVGGYLPEITSVLAADGKSAVYTIKGVVNDMSRTFTLTVDGMNIYKPTEKDETVTIKYTSEEKKDGNTWSNGLYTFYVDGRGIDGWPGSQFKINGNNCRLSVPADVKVKQFILKGYFSNYDPAANSGVKTCTSEGATVCLPTKTSYAKGSEKQYDLIINLDGHQPGKDISFTIEGGGQPVAYMELTVEKVPVATAPVLVSSSVTNTDHANHCVVALTFDREMQNATATINGKRIAAKGGATTLSFPVWDLDYESDYTLVVAAGGAKDTYGNDCERIEIPVHVGSKMAVAPAVYDYVVSNAGELDAALAALKESNVKADATRKTVFLKNGHYTYGTLTGNYQYNIDLRKDNWNHLYNVSFIGESKEGVIIEGTTDGITSSTINLGNGTGVYLQDMTIRNNYDFRATQLKGVSVAITGGNKAILKNVALQASQDTYVTGSRTYLEGCDIYGTTDFICGGGDIFFESCNLILGNKKGAVISAPSTSMANAWGYVFQNCTVKADEGAALVTDGSWNLGRPWQNEPRAYYLNTTMEVLPSAGGWTNMGNLPTHFYEYNSIDKSGKAIDLSTRQNSPTSTNTYVPVLTDDEASLFTLRNVLGGVDSWDAESYTKQTVAPVLSCEGNTLLWNAVEDARLYAIFKDGHYVANVTGTSYEATEACKYTVRAANDMGGLGAVSNEVAHAAAITVTDAQWATFSSTAALDFSSVTDLKAYTAKNNNGVIAYTQVTGAVPANTGLLIYATTAGTYSVPVASMAEMVDNDFVGTATGAVVSDGTYYALAKKTKGIGLYRVEAGGRILAGKAYIQISQAGAKAFYALADTATAIAEITGQKSGIGVDAIYNLAGQRVDSHYKGIIIKNGKKQINK